MHILIVDHDPLTLERFSLKFAEAGCTVETATDGPSGLQSIRSGRHDAVLLDPLLAHLDGFEILAALRRDRAAHPPIVVHTAIGEREDVERGLALGAADYLIKSRFTPSEVVSRVTHYAQRATA